MKLQDFDPLANWARVTRSVPCIKLSSYDDISSNKITQSFIDELFQYAVLVSIEALDCNLTSHNHS